MGANYARLAAALGQPLMDWQRYVLDVALEAKPDGTPAYRLVVVTVPRQNGKSTLLRTLRIGRALSAPRQRIVATAQTRSDGVDHWNEVATVLRATPLGERVIAQVRQGTGNERLIYRNGSTDQVIPPNEKGGHGISLDLGIIDEAWAMFDMRLTQSLIPAMAARPNGQLWIVSTAGHDRSLLLNTYCEAGRSAVDEPDSGIAYFEWSAHDGAIDDPETWQRAMPAYGVTITEAVVRQAFMSMNHDEFSRAFLNRPTVTVETLIDPALWAAAGTANQDVMPARVWLGVDVPTNREAGHVAAAYMAGDTVCVEIAATGAGTDWLAGRIAELCSRWPVAEILVDGAGPALSLASELRPHAALTLVAPRALTAACAVFHDRLLGGLLAHRGDAVLDVAVANAVRRSMGDAWLWTRRGATTDIAPLMAATLATYGAHEAAQLQPAIF